MIAYSSNCLISPGWLASIAEGDSIINATLLYFTTNTSELKREYYTFVCGVKLLSLNSCGHNDRFNSMSLVIYSVIY